MKIWIFLAGAMCGAVGYALFTNDPGLPKRADLPWLQQSDDVSVEVPVGTQSPAPEEESEVLEYSVNAETTSTKEIYSEMVATQDWAEQLRKKFEDEEKDFEWAHFNEQAIHQFLARHPMGTEFQIPSVECRSTICQIEAVGFDESTGPSWQRMMYDLNLESWASFGQVSNRFVPQNGQLMIFQELHRQNSGN